MKRSIASRNQAHSVEELQAQQTDPNARVFYEFFAGGGMARAGLHRWRCAFANDFDPMKAAVYRDNWGDDHLVCGDVAKVTTQQLPGKADLVWGSFPCQDLSLAGTIRGLGSADAERHTRSGTFWPFWSLLEALRGEGRAPRTLILENVYGALTSNQGRDFAAICQVLADAGYRFGAMVVDAKRFVAQSRPRLFIVAVREEVALPAELVSDQPSPAWSPPRLVAAYDALPETTRSKALWWALPEPEGVPTRFSELIEDHPGDVEWHSDAETAKLLAMMSPVNHAKVEAAKKAGRRMVGGVYRRTRVDSRGMKVQRAEVRFDEIAGCLRTPAGGSSRQIILVVDGSKVRSRLLSGREAARLMGLDDNYKLPTRYNDAYHVAGDGVVVPVVSHLASALVEPILDFDDSARVLLAAE